MYKAYEINIESALPLPELRLSDQTLADVRIEFGKVPERLNEVRDEGVGWQVTYNDYLLRVSGIARYRVRTGNLIEIEPENGAHEDDIRTFLLGSAFGALLHQRGLLTLHASAIHTSYGAVLFIGTSGAGKSTLLTAMLTRGYSMLADDKTAISFNEDNQPEVLPAYPFTRLWEDVLERNFPNLSGLIQIRGLSKYLVPVKSFHSRSEKLHRIYLLLPNNGPEVVLENRSDTNRIEILANNTFRKRQLHGLGRTATHFKQINQLAITIPIKVVNRPMFPIKIEELVNTLEGDWENCE
jgi:hypothetical protein